MDPGKIATEIIPRLRERRGGRCPPIHMSISSALAEAPLGGGILEDLIEQFLDHVMEISHPLRCIRVSVRRRKKAADLEKFFCIFPIHWFHLNIESQSMSGFERGIKEILRNLGYHCSEWVGMEGTESQLGAFHLRSQVLPSLVLIVQNHGSRRSCDFMIPVIESGSCFNHAL